MSRFKKIPARIISMLLVAMMVCALLPTTAFAAENEGVIQTAYHAFNPNTNTDNVISGYQVETGYGTVVLSDKTPTAVDENVYARYYGGHGGGHPKKYSNFLVQYSNPGVVTATPTAKTVPVTIGDKTVNCGAMDISFTKGSEAGSTTVTISFDINGLYDEHGISNNDYTSMWGVIQYTVTNNGSGGATVTKPNPPTDISNFTGSTGAVRVICVNDSTPTHVGKVTTLSGGKGYSFGEVVANDGRNMSAPANEYPWMCVMTLDNDYWVTLYNNSSASGNKVHYLASQTGVVSATWFSDGNNWYYDDVDVPLKVYVTETAPSHTHTDGNNDGYCDTDHTCMHEKDDKGYCTVDGCQHPHEGDGACCPLKPTTPVDPDDPNDKVSEPGMDKKANGEDEIGDLKPGDTVNFTLNSHIGEDMADALTKDANGIPVKDENGNYTGTYTLNFHDKMSANLTWNGTVTVTVDGAALDSSKYTLNSTPTDGCTFDVSIDCVALLNDGMFEHEDLGAVAVVVSYSATVDADAKDGDELKNEAWVNDSTHDVTPGDVVNPPEPPHTGGSGTTMFTVLGIVLMCGAGIALVVSRKKKSTR